MFGMFKSDKSSEMGAYYMAAECEFMNLEDGRQDFLERLDADFAMLQAMPSFTRTDSEKCLTDIMQEYDKQSHELQAAVYRNLEPYLSDAQTKGLRKDFEKYVAARIYMLRFNLAFRAMNRQAKFCVSNGLPVRDCGV